MEIEPHLLNLGYNDKLFEHIFMEGPPNTNFIDVIAWLNSELVKLCEVESFVSRDIIEGDALSFMVEVSSLLKELSCPYKSLTKGNVSDRFTLPEHKKLLIIYLSTELEAAKIQAFKYPKKKRPMEIQLDESKTAKELKEILICLKFSKPPETVTIQQIFEAIEKKLGHLSQPSNPKEKVGELLFTGSLTEKQWFNLENLYKELYEEYKVRRDLLLTRLDVTVKSFTWSDRLKSKSEKIMNVYEKYKSGILLEPMVRISDIISANSNLAVIEKTSSACVRKNTKSSINSVLIGAVPDRGGRPEEQQPPPPEIPSWQKNDLFSKRDLKSSNPPFSTNKDRENVSGKNCFFAPNEYPISHASINNFLKKDSRGNKDLRTGSVGTFASSSYQPRYYYTQLGNPPFGFGGYMPAGNDYQQYGRGDGVNQINQRSYNQTRAPFRGSRSGYRSGYSYRGS